MTYIIYLVLDSKSYRVHAIKETLGCVKVDVMGEFEVQEEDGETDITVPHRQPLTVFSFFTLGFLQHQAVEKSMKQAGDKKS